MSTDNPRLDAVKVSERHETIRCCVIVGSCLLALWYAFYWCTPIRDAAILPFDSKVVVDTVKGKHH